MWFFSPPKARSRSLVRPGRCFYQPRLERLEDRTVPASLGYSTFLNGTIYASAVDSAGDMYVTGTSPNLPTTQGAFQTNGSGAFVAKLNPAGTAVLYATYLGNGGTGTGIAVDAAGDAYVIGDGGNLPTSANAIASSGGGDFVAELNPTGSGLIYSTYLPGTFNYGYTEGYSGAIAVDAAGNIDVAGTAGSGLPVTTARAYQTTPLGGTDPFFAKINPTLSGSASVLYATFLGGSSGFDQASGHCSRQRRQCLCDRLHALDQFPDDQRGVPEDLQWQRRRVRGQVQSRTLRSGVTGLLHLPGWQRPHRLRVHRWRH
jgi:hypothetical protein